MVEIAPIFVSVKQAAVLLNITPWSVYRLLDAGEIASQYHGKRRLVRLASVQEYADRLPSEPESA